MGWMGTRPPSVHFTSRLPFIILQLDIHSRLKNVIEHLNEEAYFNAIPVNFAPCFDILNGVHDKVGLLQFTVGLSMRSGHDFSNVTQLGKEARDKLGSRLVTWGLFIVPITF